MSTQSAHFPYQIFDNRNIIHPYVQADHHILCKQFNTCRDLAKYQGHQILATLYMQW